MICIESLLPRGNRLQTVGDSRERRRNILVCRVSGQLRTGLGHGLADDPRLGQPFVDIVLFGPIGRPDDALRRGLVQVRFIAQLPVRELAALEGLARQRRCRQEAVQSSAAVLAQVEPMNELCTGPGGVGLEVGRPDVENIRVVRGFAGDDGTVSGNLQAGIVQRVVPNLVYIVFLVSVNQSLQSAA